MYEFWARLGDSWIETFIRKQFRSMRADNPAHIRMSTYLDDSVELWRSSRNDRMNSSIYALQSHPQA
ncbi:hypothetical protein FRC18_003136, partial [Serendipita sp. 400]